MMLSIIVVAACLSLSIITIRIYQNRALAFISIECLHEALNICLPVHLNDKHIIERFLLRLPAVLLLATHSNHYPSIHVTQTSYQYLLV